MMKKTVIRHLDLLQQECAEVIHIAAKIKKFGPENWNPNDPKKTTNKDLLEQELGDLHYALFLVFNSMDLDMKKVLEHKDKKAEKLKQYREVNW